MKNFIDITPAAADFIKSSIKREKCLGMRLSVKSGGCSGMAYEMEFVRKADPADLTVRKNGATVYISPKSAIFIANMTMDYVTNAMGGGIVFENPNAKVKCACGKSFSINDAAPCLSDCCKR